MMGNVWTRAMALTTPEQDRALFLKDMGVTAMALTAATFLLTVLLLRFIIPVLRAKKIGQSIREEGPSWHQSKAGTPTMGGIGFIRAILIVLAVFAVIVSVVPSFSNVGFQLIPLALALCLGVAHAMIGFVDDYCKLLKKQNEGLTAIQKFLLQVFVTAAYLILMRCTGHLETALYIPFAGVSLELGWVAYVVYLLVIVGFVNSTNLTDGLDGLASCVCAVVCGFMILTAFRMQSPELSALSCTLLGGMLGFLVYNHHPAKVFMGDTGSLFLGGIIMGGAIMTGQLLVFVLAGLVFVIEMLSSLLQITFFKLTHGKRIFKMAPLHHHFEKCGLNEVQIVALFAGVSVLFCVAAWFGL